MATTQIADIVVPSVFTPYVQQATEEKSRIIQSGAMQVNAEMSAMLAGGGLVFTLPSFKDLTNEDDNISSDDPDTNATPGKIGTSSEKGVRLSRNKSWSSMDLSQALAGADPAQAIQDKVAGYWSRRLQAATVATLQGVFADNAAAPSGTEHVQNDLTNNVSGASYTAGVTDFSSSAFLDTLVTMGDSQDGLGIVLVHSVVYNRMQKQNLIDFIPDSQGVVNIPTYMGRLVIVDDGLPNPAGVGAAQTSSGIYHSWVVGAGALQFGRNVPKVPTEVLRKPDAGNGAGEERLYSRTEWMIHPVGHAYVGTPANGGPSNAATTNNLAAAGSWQRVYPERKQIKIARLITREA